MEPAFPGRRTRKGALREMSRRGTRRRSAGRSDSPSRGVSEKHPSQAGRELHEEGASANRVLSGKPQLSRRINASLILGLIRREGRLSRADLVRLTGLRATSVSDIVDQLLEHNLLREVGPGRSTGGRPPVMLEINPRGLCAAGFEITPAEVRAVLVDFSGNAAARLSYSLESPEPETVVDTIAGVLRDIRRRAGGLARKLAGLGVAIPGIINKDEARVVFSRPLGWKNVDIKALLVRRLKIDVRVMNNAVAGALAANYDCNSGEANSLLFFLIYLQGAPRSEAATVGCGIVLDDRAYLGDGHMAGEIGVTVTHPLTLAQKYGVSRGLRDMRDLVAASRAEPHRFARLWSAFARELGGLVARGVDFLNPGLVVIGTDTPELEMLAGDRIRQVLQEQSAAGRIAAGLKENTELWAPRVRFMLMECDTLARGAIVPHLQELSLLPLLREGVFM